MKRVVGYQGKADPPIAAALAAFTPTDGYKAIYPDRMARQIMAWRMRPTPTEALIPIALNVGGWSDQFYALQRPNKISTPEQFFEDAGPPEPIAINVPGWEPWFALPAKANKITSAETFAEDINPPEPVAINTPGWEPTFPVMVAPRRRAASRDDPLPPATQFIALAWVDTPTIRQVLRLAAPGIDLPTAPAFVPVILAASDPMPRLTLRAPFLERPGLVTPAASTPSAFASYPDASPRLRAPAPAQQDHAVQQVPTQFVANGWASIWEPTRKPMASALQKFDSPVLAAYATVVITYPDGWQVVGFDPTQRARPQKLDKLDLSATAQVSTAISGWDSVSSPILLKALIRQRATDDTPSGFSVFISTTWDAPQPSIVRRLRAVQAPPDLAIAAVVTTPVLVDYGFPAPVQPRVRLSPTPDLPLTLPVLNAWPGDLPVAPRRRAAPAPVPVDPGSPTVFAQMGWGTQFPDGVRRPAKQPLDLASLQIAIAAPPAAVYDFSPIPIRRQRVPAGPSAGEQGRAVVAAPGNTDLWSVASYHIRTIRGIPEFAFFGWVRVGFAIVSTPTLLGTKQGPTMYGEQAKALLSGVNAQATLDGAKAAPTLTGTKSTPTLEGDV